MRLDQALVFRDIKREETSMKLNDLLAAKQVGIQDRRPDGPPEQTVTAGGPGSGRHAGTGSIAPTSIHNALTKMGFKHQNNEGGWATYHNENTAVAAHVDSRGNHVTGMIDDGKPSNSDVSERGISNLKDNVASLAQQDDDRPPTR